MAAFLELGTSKVTSKEGRASSSSLPFQKHNLKSELKDGRNVKLKRTLKLLGSSHCFLPVAFWGSEDAVRWLAQGAGWRGEARIVPELARAPLVGEEWFLPVVDWLPLAYELSKSKSLSYTVLYLPMCLGQLGAQQILVECGRTNTVFKMESILKNGKHVSFPNWRGFLTESQCWQQLTLELW